jgi:vancomycin permeability regulator SanA
MKFFGRMATNFPNLCRGAALFLGSFVAINLGASVMGYGFDANIWLIDLRWAPEVAREAVFVVLGVAMLNYALRLRWTKLEKVATRVVISATLLALLVNSIQFWALLARGDIDSAWPAPVTVFLAVVLLAMIGTMRRDVVQVGTLRGAFVGAVVFAAGFALLQMVAFGKTNYARQGDVAVVFGARVYADGRLSEAAMDRITTACDLYRRGIVRMLVFSGGPGDGKIHETEAMRRVALERGVPESTIILDQAGLNTRSTAQNTTKIFKALGARRILAVSHFYHLPRVKLAYQQEGWEVFTVPAHSDRILMKLPVFMAREGVALVKYYFDPIVYGVRIRGPEPVS